MFIHACISGASSQPKLISAEITDDDMAVILKWCLESYSPINEYKVSDVHQECVIIYKTFENSYEGKITFSSYSWSIVA
jgi:ABC-type transporter MlaC component